MKKSKYKILSLLSLLGFLSNPLDASAHLTIYEVKEEDFDNLENGKNIEVGTTIIENSEKEVLSNNVVRFVDDLELGDIVLVNGVGNSESCGKGIETRKVTNETMAIVGTKSDEVYDYALAEINKQGKLGDIIGWFKGEDLKARISFKKIRECADIERTIANASDVGISGIYYNPETDKCEDDVFMIDSDFEWYGSEHAISYKYIWPEVDFDYEYSVEEKYTDTVNVVEYKLNSEQSNKIYRYKDIENGTIEYTTEEARDKVSTDTKSLAKRYGIKSY